MQRELAMTAFVSELITIKVKISRKHSIVPIQYHLNSDVSPGAARIMPGQNGDESWKEGGKVPAGFYYCVIPLLLRSKQTLLLCCAAAAWLLAAALHSRGEHNSLGTFTFSA